MKHKKVNRSRSEYVPGNKLCMMRKRQYLSQRQLAHRIGHKSTSLLHRWEHGSTPDLINAFKLSIALSTPIELLFPEHYSFLKSQIAPCSEQSTDT